MPARARQVGFAPVPATYSRLPHDDELLVMQDFARHCSHCSKCAHPYESHMKGRTLCNKGHQRAIDVAQYLYNKSGKFYSVIDRDSNKRIQVEIPADCAPVRELLKAMERGLRLSQSKPIKSYDDNYVVPSRRPKQPQYESPEPTRSSHRRHVEIIEPSSSRSHQPKYDLIEPSSSRRPRPSSYHAPSGSRDSGSKHTSRQPKYYTLGSKGVLPLPSKHDDYWD